MPEAAATQAFIGRDGRAATHRGPAGAGRLPPALPDRPGRHGQDEPRAPGAAEPAPRSFADGATFVALEELAAATELGGRIAHELDIALKGRADPMQQVIEALRARQLLLVLDNFEQLADGAPPARAAAGGLSAREAAGHLARAAGAAGEWLLPLEGLPCPEDEDRDHIESFDAARLFVRAARRVQPDLVPGGRGRGDRRDLPPGRRPAAGARAGRVVDARAVVRSRSPRNCAAAAELLQRQPTRRSRRATPASRRSSSSRGGCSASASATRWLRLAVFHGSFTLEAARAVARRAAAGAGRADRQVAAAPVTATRLRLHPLVQQWAARKLHASDGGAGDRSGARQLLLPAAGEAGPERRTRATPTCCGWSTLEFDNYLRGLALGHCSTARRARLERSSRVADALLRPSRPRLPRDWRCCDEAMRGAGGAGRCGTARTAAQRAPLTWSTGSTATPRPIAHARAALAAARRAATRSRRGCQALTVLGGCALQARPLRGRAPPLRADAARSRATRAATRTTWPTRSTTWR
ncbi:MAG: hypothetical protein MZW92_76005 [Comamonadaceae bacterium]|nr:hypothetical protein [Comamonadaceae bacterium]